MCFSAKASFIAAGGLSLIGLLSLNAARKKNISYLIPFASTPLFFALQQFSEGLVWIGLTKGLPSYLYTMSMYSFIFFAGTWWPCWVPTTMYFLEQNNFRKKLLRIASIVGICIGTLYLLSLLTQPIQAFVVEHHIYYPTLSYPFYSINTVAEYIESSISYLYPIATVVPFFVSSIAWMWILGIIMGTACVVSQILFVPATASTWCFFAALASMLIYGITKNYKTV